jgi:three-Cys-motif partner protein
MPKVQLEDYGGREQAYVKHRLLAEYLPPFAYKVGSAWDSIVYVDAFSGPWKTNRADYADSSFAIAIETLRDAQIGLGEKGKNRRVECILIEEDEKAFGELQTFAATQTSPLFGVHALCGRFIEEIPAINNLIRKHAARNPFKFVFLDPKGWADIPMRTMAPFLRGRSCEVLINLMTRHIIRFLEEEDRAESYHNLFGRQEVLEVLRKTPREDNERTEQAVREYCRSLKLLCGYKFVSSAVILEPNEESVKYYLVYATNNFHGIEVFKKAEGTAARVQDDVRLHARGKPSGQTELLLEGGSKESRLAATLRLRYQSRAHRKVMDMLLSSQRPSGIAYVDLYCEAMAFPLVSPNDLRDWLQEFQPYVEVQLAGSKNRRKPSPGESDRVKVMDAIALRRAYSTQ